MRPSLPDLAPGQDTVVAKAVRDPVAVLPIGQQFHSDAVRMDGHELGDLAPAVGEDLVVGVAPQSQMSLQHLPPLERVLKPVGPLGQQVMQPVVSDPVLAPVASSAIHDHGQRGHGLGQDAHAGVDSSQSQRPIRRDPHPRGAARGDRLKEEVTPGGSIVAGGLEAAKKTEQSHVVRASAIRSRIPAPQSPRA